MIRSHIVATETAAGRSEICRPVSWSVQFAFPPEDISCIFITDKVIKICWTDPQKFNQDIVINLYDIH